MTNEQKVFLMNRKFFVNIIDSNSLLFSILSGLAQGSTIYPTLFALYMSDIDSKNLIIVNIALYADDICIWFSSENLKTIQSILQDAINIIVKFFKTWCLNIYISKTSFSLLLVIAKVMKDNIQFHCILIVKNLRTLVNNLRTFSKILGGSLSIRQSL
jgi:hypothetical protein